jgi:hypothetical protein
MKEQSKSEAMGEIVVPILRFLLFSFHACKQHSACSEEISNTDNGLGGL